jgi:DNA-binding MarR family transcriptional regulator
MLETRPPSSAFISPAKKAREASQPCCRAISSTLNIDQNALVARLGIDRYGASLLVERLEKQRIVERRVNGADRRARLLRLTARREKPYARLRAPVGALLARLSAMERELFLDLLMRVVQANTAWARPGAESL